MSLMLQRWAALYKMTPAEHALEPAIAKLGERYRPQYPFWGLGCFADFALLDRKLVIEVDDPSHLKPEKVLKDAERTAKLEKLGWRVVRCTNADAIRDPESTLARMLLAVQPPLDSVQSAPAGGVALELPTTRPADPESDSPSAPRRRRKHRAR